MSEADRWDPSSYPQEIREEIPDYDRLQAEVVAAARGRAVSTILELGTGSGETARRIVDLYPDARFLGIDASKAMLTAARAELRGPRVNLQLGRLEDALPPGRYDLVVSALAVHHLDAAGKADLFARVARALSPGGRMVLADVVVPHDAADALIPLEEGYDRPSSVEEQLEWLRKAGLHPTVHWRKHDLAVLVADAPGRS